MKTFIYYQKKKKPAGLLDEVAIYNEALTICEIRCHYNLGLDGLGYCDGTVQNIDTNIWYHWIQDAIDASIDGQEIEVYTPDIDVHGNEMYVENLFVDKELTIRAADGCSPIIDGGLAGNVVFIYASHVSIIGFRIQNSDIYGSGVVLDENRCYNTVDNNVITDNGNGVYLVDHSNYNTISYNTIIENDIGIYSTYLSQVNSIFNNTIEDNEQGILFDQSIINSIYNNTIIFNRDDGVHFRHSSDNNLIHGNNISHNGVNSYSNSGIILVSCKNNIISYNIITFNGDGINNGDGIRLVESSYNTIFCNNISSNYGYGIYMDEGSSNNLIYSNNFIKNGVAHAYDPYINSWNYDWKWGGNYWDDHPGGSKYRVLIAPRNIWRWSLHYSDIHGGGGNEDKYPLVNMSECAPGVPNLFNQPSTQSVQQYTKLSHNPSSRQNIKQTSFLILRYILGLL